MYEVRMYIDGDGEDSPYHRDLCVVTVDGESTTAVGRTRTATFSSYSLEEDGPIEVLIDTQNTGTFCSIFESLERSPPIIKTKI